VADLGNARVTNRIGCDNIVLLEVKCTYSLA